MKSKEKRVEQTEGFRLSPHQTNIWRQIVAAPTCNFANQIAISIRGPLDVVRLRNAVRRVVLENEILRTRFVLQGPMSIPVQSIDDFAIPDFQFVDLSFLAGDDQQRVLKEEWGNNLKRSNAMPQTVSVFYRLFKLQSDLHVLHVVSSALCSDLSGLCSLYEQAVLAYGRQYPATNRMQYADIAEWECLVSEGAGAEAGLSYWNDYTAQASGQAVVIQTESHSGSEKCRNGARECLEAASPQWMSRNCGGKPLREPLLAAWLWLVHNYRSYDGDLIQVAVDARTHGIADDTIGPLTRFVPVRASFPPAAYCSEVMQTLREQLAQHHAFAHFYSQPDGHSIGHGRTSCGFAFHSLSTRRAVEGVEFTIVAAESDCDTSPLFLSLFSQEKMLRAAIYFDSSKYTSSFIALLAEKWKGLAEEFLEQQGETARKKITELKLLREDERRHILIDWNRTERAYAPGKTLIELFEQQVDRNAEAEAVRYGEHRLTYRELNRRANQLAHYLREIGVQPEVHVALLIDRSLDMVVAILGVLKAGGAYVPLDPEHPLERLRFIMADAQAPLLLTHERLEKKLTKLGNVRVVCLDQLQSVLEKREEQSPVPLAKAENAAYVIYTSGSTGKSKGVVVQHDSVCNYLCWCNETYPLETANGSVVHTPLVFDLTVTALLAPLLCGSKVLLLPEGLGVDHLGRALQEEAVRGGFSLVKLTPAHLNMLDHDLEQVCKGTLSLVVGGEALPTGIVRRWQEVDRGVRIFNEYGPTEATVGCCIYEAGTAPEHVSVPIGRPIANMRAYVLDEHMEPLPLEVAGELYVGGMGLARGYLGRPELTAERFVPSPFSNKPGDRLYSTGDLAKWRTDGQLEYLGRIDDQVKIRGYRIEPGEIEAALREHEGVRHAAVVAREDKAGQKDLVAYVVLDQRATLDSEELAHDLREKLPVYMLPSNIVILERFPLTPNGKLDRRALAPPQRSSVPYRAPRTAEEEILCGIFAEVLSLDRVGIDENFFTLGGHSLLAMSVMSRVRTSLNAHLPVRVLFDAPTVADLVQHLQWGRSVRLALEPQARPERLPLSYAQQRLWFIDQLNESSTEYNVSVTLRLRGELDQQALERAINTIVERHESLRTHFSRGEDGPVQIIAPTLQVKVPLESLTKLDEASRQIAVQRALEREREERFNLERGALVRFRLLRLSDREHVFAATFHHIVADGWSLAIFGSELVQLYEAFHEGHPDPLPPLPIQYADFTLWQRACLEGEPMKQSLAYWKEQLSGIPGQLQLPIDKRRPLTATHDARKYRVDISPELTKSLKDFSKSRQATLYMTLLTGFSALLAAYSGQDDLVVGTPIANRQDKQLEQLIGFFVNSLAIRVRVDRGRTFAALLAAVRTTTLDAYQNQDIPFELLVKELSWDRDPSRTPIFQVMFALQNVPQVQLHVKELGVEVGANDGLQVHYDLELYASGQRDMIELHWEYNCDLFDDRRIEQMAKHYIRIVEAGIASPDAPLWELSMLGKEERRSLLEDFNPTNQPSPTTTLIELFEEQVNRTPGNTALVFGDEALCYADLNRRANQVANHLLRNGVQVEEPVGVCLDRSPDMVIAILGVLKSGAAYVPLDVTYPADRMRHTLNDAGVRIVLTKTDDSAALLKESGLAEVEFIKLDRDLQDAESCDNPCIRVAPENLAYVIYTSGSTGSPKGVMVSHGNVVRLLGQTRNWFNFSERDVWTLFHSHAFDVSVWELWGALLHGGRLVIIPYWVSRSPNEFHELLVKEGVTILSQTPSAFLQLIQADQARASGDGLKLRCVIFAGEALEPKSLETWVRAHQDLPKLINMYGITETTVHVTYRELMSEEVLRGVGSVVGCPIPDLRLYILDSQLEPVPIGVAGELYVGGAGLARGYLNRPELTAERFIPDLFGVEGARLYRSGDLVRRLANGDLEYLGRCDQQVKLRGFRIEPGEIETILRQNSEIHAAVVTLREDPSREKLLVAYVEPKKGAKIDSVDLKNQLRAKLPAFMVPSAIVVLERFPLTPNGKLDRGALPPPEWHSKIYRSPRTPEERLVCEIFTEILSVGWIGLDDNFFELGGHSMLAARLLGRIQKEFGTVIALATFYDEPTPEKVASLLHGRSGPVASRSLVPIQREGSRVPFFVVHPASGSVLCYYKLAQLVGAEQPFYGLQSQGLSGTGGALSEIETMAAHYVAEIRKRFPRGPYQLGGWSLGGIVAFEMAQQMTRLECEVSLLAVMDVGPRACQKDTPLPDDATLLLEAFASEGLRLPRDLDRSNSEALFAHALNWAKEAGWVPRYTELPDFRCYFQIYKLNGAALSRYVPTPYDGEITLFRCAAPREGEAAEADLGWSRLAKRGVKIVQVPGDHHTIIKEPHVHELARELRVHLGQMSQNPGLGSNTFPTRAHTSTILNALT